MMRLLQLACSILVAAVSCQFGQTSFGQTIVKSESFKVSSKVRNLYSTRGRLFVWTENGFSEMVDGKPVGKTYLAITIAPSGHAIALDFQGQTLQLIDLDSRSSERVVEYAAERPQKAILVSNEDNSRIWAVLFWDKSNRLLTIDPAKKQLIGDCELSFEFVDDANVYVGSGHKLLMACLSIRPSGVAYEIRVIESEGVLGKPLHVFDNTIILRLETLQDGSIIACGRNELHQPDIGFVCNLETDSFKRRWTSQKIIPYCMALNGRKITLSEGSNEVIVLDATTGSQTERMTIGAQPLIRLTSSGDTVWGLCSDQQTVVRAELSK